MPAPRHLEASGRRELVCAELAETVVLFGLTAALARPRSHFTLNTAHPMPLTFRMHRVPSPRRPAVEPMDASALRAMCEPIEVDTIEEAEARDAEWQAAIAANERLMEEMKITPRR